MTIFNRSHIVNLIAAVATTAAMGAFAGEAKHGQIPFAAFDQDGNGWVSKAEFNQVRARMMSGTNSHGKHMPSFADFDKNGDGKLSKSELAAGH